MRAGPVIAWLILHGRGQSRTTLSREKHRQMRQIDQVLERLKLIVGSLSLSTAVLLSFRYTGTATSLKPLFT
jgi:hypothetical protein